MRRLILAVLMILIPLSGARAASNDCFVETNAPTLTAKTSAPCSQDLNGNIRTLDASIPPGGDVLNDVQKAETRFLTIPSGGTTAKVSADQLYRTGPGLVSYLACYSVGTATAGTIAVLDGTAAGAGNVLYQLEVSAVSYLPFVIPLNTPFSIGLFLDYTTANMPCTLGYR